MRGSRRGVFQNYQPSYGEITSVQSVEILVLLISSQYSDCKLPSQTHCLSYLDADTGPVKLKCYLCAEFLQQDSDCDLTCPALTVGVANLRGAPA